MALAAWRRAALAGMLTVAVTMAVAGGPRVWACVPQPLVTLRPHSSGAPGSDVTVEAVSVAGNAEVRWNTIDGPLLATATGPTFSVPVTVPADGPEGLYAIIVLERRPDGSVGSTGRASFLVLGPSVQGIERDGSPPPPVAPGDPVPEARSSNAPMVLSGAVLFVAGGLVGGLVSRRVRRA